MNNIYSSVGIVVVNYNGLDISKECIDSLLSIDYPNYTIIFVDNGSKDGSGRKISELFKDKIVYIPLPVNLGVTGGNNAGINYSTANNLDYVLFLNNDTVVEKDFLEKLVNVSINNENALAVPKIICYFDKKRLDQLVGKEFDWWTTRPIDYKYYPIDAPEYNIRADIKVASTCCLLVPIAVFKHIGIMDEKYFMYFDDADFTLRASKMGHRIIYEPASSIYHKCNITTSKQHSTYFQYYLMFRNIFYFYNKLCDKPVAKYFVLGNHLIKLFWHIIKTTFSPNAGLKQASRAVLRDILKGNMGILKENFK